MSSQHEYQQMLGHNRHAAWLVDGYRNGGDVAWDFGKDVTFDFLLSTT